MQYHMIMDSLLRFIQSNKLYTVFIVSVVLFAVFADPVLLMLRYDEIPPNPGIAVLWIPSLILYFFTIIWTLSLLVHRLNKWSLEILTTPQGKFRLKRIKKVVLIIMLFILLGMAIYPQLVTRLSF